MPPCGARPARDPRRHVRPSQRGPPARRLSAVLRPRRGRHAVGRRRQRLCRLHVRLRPDGAGLRQPRGRGRRRCAARAGRRADRAVASGWSSWPRSWSAWWRMPTGRCSSKNGTDATTLCVVIARAATQKRKILVARGAYHGSAPWCTPHPDRHDRRGPRRNWCTTTTTTSPACRPRSPSAERRHRRRHRLGLQARLRPGPGAADTRFRRSACARSATRPARR